MPKFIDLSGGRARQFADFDRTIWRPGQLAAIDEMVAGDHHHALPLGGPDTVRNAHATAASPIIGLEVAGAYFQHLAPGPADEIILDRAIYGPDGTDIPATLIRYISAVRPLAPDRMHTTPAHAEALRADGASLLAAVATIRDPDSVAQFDVLYVPRAWEALPPPPGIEPREHAVGLAAGYIILGMTGTQHIGR